MEILGRDSRGGVVAKLTEEEANAFERLRAACSDHAFVSRNAHDFVGQAADGYDFAGPLGAVAAFTLARFRLNEFRWMLGKFEEALEAPPSPKDDATPCMICHRGVFRWRDFSQAPLCAGHYKWLSKTEYRHVEEYFRAERAEEEKRGDSYNGKAVLGYCPGDGSPAERWSKICDRLTDVAPDHVTDGTAS